MLGSVLPNLLDILFNPLAHEPTTPTTAVLELTHDTAEGRWQLVGCTD
mgnify:CR=1 FL=1